MLKGVDINSRFNFISSEDITEPKTIFILKPLSSFEMMTHSDLKSKGDLLELVKLSIESIQNIDAEKDEFIESIPVKTLSEMVKYILEINNLTESDKKKF